ncbi:MAG: diguanylate cyclase domain-containing protein [Pseudomonadales bacterium]
MTKLENIHFFSSWIESAISSALHSSIESILLVIRIDRFSSLLETLGGSGSNKILECISTFLKTAINNPFPGGARL